MLLWTRVANNSTHKCFGLVLYNNFIYSLFKIKNMLIELNFSNDYVLEDERVLLRPLEMDDYEASFALCIAGD